MTAFDSGRIELAIRTVRESVAAVSLRQPGSAARLAGLGLSLMSSMGDLDPARQEMARLAQPGPDRVEAEVDSDDAEQQWNFAARLKSALLELTQDTLQVSTDPGALATIAHRWLEIAERLEKVAGPGAGELGLATQLSMPAWLASMT